MPRYTDVLDYLGLEDCKGRKECPLCGSSDGLHVSVESTREGEVYCYSCQSPNPGTGVELYRRLEGVSKAEAMEAFGIKVEGQPEDDRKAEQAQEEWRRHKEAAEIRPEDHLLEIERAKTRMTEQERGLFSMCCSKLRLYPVPESVHPDEICNCGRAGFSDEAYSSSSDSAGLSSRGAGVMRVWMYGMDWMWMKALRKEIRVRALGRARQQRHNIEFF